MKRRSPLRAPERCVGRVVDAGQDQAAEELGLAVEAEVDRGAERTAIALGMGDEEPIADPSCLEPADEDAAVCARDVGVMLESIRWRDLSGRDGVEGVELGVFDDPVAWATFCAQPPC